MTLWKAIKTLHGVINGRGGRSKSDVFLIPESKTLIFSPLSGVCWQDGDRILSGMLCSGNSEYRHWNQANFKQDHCDKNRIRDKMFAIHKFSTWQCHAGGHYLKSKLLLLFTSNETESHCLFYQFSWILSAKLAMKAKMHFLSLCHKETDTEQARMFK